MRRTDIRSSLGFLTLALIGASCGGSLTPQPDAAPDVSPDVPPNVCANAGCALPPLCSVGCTATCGCCNCAPGERNGDLVCTEQGCFAPAPATDGGADGAGSVCSLPFDPGPCEAAFPVYAFVNGACTVQIYGGCQGNGNRFETLEACMATCVGAPGACPPNRIAREVCLGCGPAGGCPRMATVCALVCDVDGVATGCEPLLPVCWQGVCQNAFCI